MKKIVCIIIIFFLLFSSFFSINVGAEEENETLEIISSGNYEDGYR